MSDQRRYFLSAMNWEKIAGYDSKIKGKTLNKAKLKKLSIYLMLKVTAKFSIKKSQKDAQIWLKKRLARYHIAVVVQYYLQAFILVFGEVKSGLGKGL